MSEKAKHTPGPWKTYGLAIYTEAKRKHWVSPRDPKQSLIANARDNWLDDPENIDDNPPFMAEAEANARLIACAPELLEALEAVLFSAEAMKEERDGINGYSGEPESFRVARAAIAKARGEKGGGL